MNLPDVSVTIDSKDMCLLIFDKKTSKTWNACGLSTYNGDTTEQIKEWFK